MGSKRAVMFNLLRYTSVCVILSTLYLQEISGAKVCGLENLVPCDVANVSCVLNTLEPQVLQWFKNGKPEYFLKDVDTLNFGDIDIPVKDDGAYYLSNVTVVEACSSRLSEYIFDRRGENEGFMNYTYVFNLKVRADPIYKVVENEEFITFSYNKKPLALKLRDVKIKISVPMNLVQRCDGSEFMVLKDEILTLDAYPHNCVTYESGKPANCDLEAFNRGLIDKISNSVARSLINNYRAMFKLVDINNFLVFNPDKKKTKKHCH